MSFICTQSGIHWHYDLQGQGDSLLFLHGWGVDRRIWRQQLKYFCQNYQTLSLDLPGHGQSSWQKITLEAMAHDLFAVLEKLKCGNVTIVGSSLGGLLALKFYSLYSARIRGLVFVGSMPKFSQSPDYPFGLDVARMRKLGEQLESDYPSIVNIFFRSLFTREERESRRFKWLQKFRQADGAPMKPALVEYLDILEQEDLRSVLNELKVPVQFMNGTHDEICTRPTVAFLKKSLPSARFDDFDQCGHFPFLSKPYEFNQILEEFLKAA